MFIKMLLLLIATFGLSDGQPTTEGKFVFEWEDDCYITLVFAEAETTYEDLLLLDGRILPRQRHTTYHRSKSVVLEEGTTFRFEMLETGGLKPSVLITGTTQFSVDQWYSGGGTLHRSDQFSNGTEAVEIRDRWVGSYRVALALEPVHITIWPVGQTYEDFVALPMRVVSCNN